MNEEPQPAYRATHVIPGRGYNEIDGAHKVYNVHYVTANGVQDYITVPENEYTMENVQKKLQSAAERHLQIGSVQGPPVYPGQTAAHNPFINEYQTPSKTAP